MMYYGYTMYDYGLHHLVMLVLAAIFLLFPCGRILSRAGFSPIWSLLVLIPIINIALLWVFAMIDWPAIPAARPGAQSGGSSAAP